MFQVEYTMNGQTRSAQYNRPDLAKRFAQSLAQRADDKRAMVVDCRTGQTVFTVDLSAR